MERAVQMAEMAVEADRETLRLPLAGLVAAVVLGGALWAAIAWSVWSLIG